MTIENNYKIGWEAGFEQGQDAERKRILEMIDNLCFEDSAMMMLDCIRRGTSRKGDYDLLIKTSLEEQISSPSDKEVKE